MQQVNGASGTGSWQYELLANAISTTEAYYRLIRAQASGDNDLIERAQAVVDLVRARDKMNASRECGCLGFGGYHPRYRPDGEGGAILVWEEFCFCAEGQAEQRRVQEEIGLAMAAQTQARLERVFKMVPADWREWTLRSWAQNAGDPETARHLGAWLATDAWLYLWGPVGVGKSGAAWPLVKEFIARGRSGALVNVPEILDHIRTTYGSFDNMRSQEQNPWSLLESAEMLCLDDLGAQRSTDWANERLYMLINHRHSNSLRTIVTSNDDLDTLRKKMGQVGDANGERICSRILGKCGDEWTVQLRGLDRRVAP